jgi:hypothetical protein
MSGFFSSPETICRFKLSVGERIKIYPTNFLNALKTDFKELFSSELLEMLLAPSTVFFFFAFWIVLNPSFADVKCTKANEF